MVLKPQIKEQQTNSYSSISLRIFSFLTSSNFFRLCIFRFYKGGCCLNLRFKRWPASSVLQKIHCLEDKTQPLLPFATRTATNAIKLETDRISFIERNHQYIPDQILHLLFSFVKVCPRYIPNKLFWSPGFAKMFKGRVKLLLILMVRYP